MKNKALPRIYCNSCNKTQDWRNQPACLSCGERLNDWSVASQLRCQRDNEQVRQWEVQMNNDHEDDGS